MVEKKKYQRTVADQIELKGTDEKVKDRTFFIFQGTEEAVSYARFYQRSSVFAHLFLERHQAAAPPGDNVRVAVFMDNHPSFLYAYGGCALTAGTLFGINTGLRGQVLADLINQSRCQTLICDDRHLDRVLDTIDKFEHLTPERIYVQITDHDATKPAQFEELDRVLDRVRDRLGDAAQVRPQLEVPIDATLMIIYTSGTTGLPKGIKNSQGKLGNLGMVTSIALQLKDSDRGYICMPLFHSNAMFLGIMSAFEKCASTVVRDRFSATGFIEDVLKYGVTYWNYVGQPVHYIILALERMYKSREELLTAVAQHPNNKFRVAYGNGASQLDQDKFIEYFKLQDMMEGYGTTEMAIAVLRHVGDPKGSVGFIMDSKVKIYNDHDRECPAAIYDESGHFTNYQEAVGEIVREGGPLPAFEGYHDNPDAGSKKMRDGVYHSGDLGHIRVLNNKRYLYFDGRTDDWIRKDGENFSAETVAQAVAGAPAVELAAAYGVPCPVSDEWVMVAVKLHEGKKFDPANLHRYLTQQAAGGDMDKKWLPDFVRVVPDFEYTRTQKILVRSLKHEYYNPDYLPAGTVFFIRRGMDSYRPFTPADYRALSKEFAQNGREQVLETWR